jgi:hypothetical protein
MDVPSPKSSDQLAMLPSGSLLPVPRNRNVFEHSDGGLNAPQPHWKKPGWPAPCWPGSMSGTWSGPVQALRGIDCSQIRPS